MKTFALANITQAPTTTVIGIGTLLTGIGSAFANGLPQSTSGWVAAVAQVAVAVGAMLSK